MAGTIAPYVFWQSLDDNGDPLDGAQLFTYAAGTSTKQATYSDAALTTPNSNPIVLDAAGRATIYLGPGSYKFVLAPADDTDPPVSPIETRDNIQAIPEVTTNAEVEGIIGENVTANACLYLSSGLGSKTAGYWYLADAAADYSSITAEDFGFAVTTADSGNTISIRKVGWMEGFTGLTAGTVYYVDASTPGALTSTAPTRALPVGVGDSPTSMVLGGLPRIVYARPPKRLLGSSTTAAAQLRMPAVLMSGYSGGSTTVSIGVLAGSLATNGDQLVCEWYTDYSSATLSARVSWEGTNKDLGTGGNTTTTYCKATLTRESNTTIRVDMAGQQSAVAMGSTDTVGSLDLDATAYTVTLGMASGTYTIRSYRVTFYPAT